MNLSELVSHQDNWENSRGITEEINGKWNIDRVQTEVDELREAQDPYDAINEALDSIIVLAGGIARSAKAAGIPLSQIDGMLQQILRKNEHKYSLENWDARDPEASIAHARLNWLANLDTGEVE